MQTAILVGTRDTWYCHICLLCCFTFGEQVSIRNITIPFRDVNWCRVMYRARRGNYKQFAGVIVESHHNLVLESGVTRLKCRIWGSNKICISFCQSCSPFGRLSWHGYRIYYTRRADAQKKNDLWEGSRTGWFFLSFLTVMNQKATSTHA